jgi:hypothetical protein
MNARTFAVTILAALLTVLTLAGCSRTESAEAVGPRLHRECVSIVAAAVAAAPSDERDEVRDHRDALIFNCILKRGNARNGDER